MIPELPVSGQPNGPGLQGKLKALFGWTLGSLSALLGTRDFPKELGAALCEALCFAPFSEALSRLGM